MNRNKNNIIFFIIFYTLTYTSEVLNLLHKDTTFFSYKKIFFIIPIKKIKKDKNGYFYFIYTI